MDLDLSQLTIQQLIYCGFFEEAQKRIQNQRNNYVDEDIKNIPIKKINEQIDQRKVPFMYLQTIFITNFEQPEEDKACTAIYTRFTHNEQFDCDDIIIINCNNKRSMPIGSCVAIETEKGFHYILPFDGKFDITDDRDSDEKLDNLWNHPLQYDKYIINTVEKGVWVQLTHNKINNQLRKAIPLDPAWEAYCKEWNRLANLANETKEV